MRGPLHIMDLHLPFVFAQAGLFDPKGMLIPIVGTLAIMYFLVIRPQQKQAKDTQTMLSSLKKGDDVVTSGGILGKVHVVDDKTVTVDVGGGTRLRILKSAIQSKVNVEAPKEAPKAEGTEGKKEEK
jgi:preprotein translocase subunit YajC